ncbi:ABC transporter ATP-binding protein [Leptospira gomenensis]|uniref:ABC transporter ATP-binding protein n=1 Tax=Leptospira gomenensis TaxID=2484974 RepID=A0A5F1YGK8_9LEPT|nr:ABC transporter ATP-binding protein [Leptospira gomenensis]TGK28810.1 ABC transporter ATP-binding protein [Leptospira gomenensis]TGK40984.1 ABC transporter ATP-binding protein [Leptospira gomenensis]TGK46164.1 ABC transporter ATP-binding protein [Leptospira gomenensis]TGK54689.1 ABC transporter ATP-binding protein [Leptospira gomenensis]
MRNEKSLNDEKKNIAIQVNDIRKTFGNSEIIKGIGLEIEEGDYVSLTGKSGSGKSTLLYMISSLDPPSAGKIFIEGNDLYLMKEREIHEFRNKKMGFIFQFHYLLPEFTALENVLMPARKAGTLKRSRSYAEHLLEEFDLKDRMDYRIGKLSGGQAQRVAIARALVMHPKYIFADEPTGALDSTNTKVVINILEKVNREKNTTILVVTHDNEFASKTKRQIRLVDGKIVP